MKCCSLSLNLKQIYKKLVSEQYSNVLLVADAVVVVTVLVIVVVESVVVNAVMRIISLN